MIEQRNNRKTIIIIILTLLTLALAGLSSYLLFFKEEGKVECKKNETNNKKEESTSIQNKIEIYGKKFDTGTYYICNHQSESDDCKELLFSIDTETSNATIIHKSLQYVVYYDNGVKLYNIKDKNVSKLDIEINGNIEWLEDGFINNSDDGAYYFDLKSNKKIYDKYDELYPVEDIHEDSSSSNPKFLCGSKGKTSSLIDFKTGNVIITIDNSSYEAVGFKRDGSFIIASLYGTEDTTNVIYNTKGEKIVELQDNQTYETKGSKIIVYEQTLKKVKEY